MCCPLIEVGNLTEVEQMPNHLGVHAKDGSDKRYPRPGSSSRQTASEEELGSPGRAVGEMGLRTQLQGILTLFAGVACWNLWCLQIQVAVATVQLHESGFAHRPSSGGAPS